MLVLSFKKSFVSYEYGVIISCNGRIKYHFKYLCKEKKLVTSRSFHMVIHPVKLTI